MGTHLVIQDPLSTTTTKKMDSIEKVTDDEERIEIRIQGGKFKQFDIIEEASSLSDHYYYSRRQKKYSDQLRNRISQEWDTFRERLPDSIFVRVNRERPDLLRAVIVGPQGSPFHDGLFFFDIQFPSNYPDIPPNIHYCCYDVKSMIRYIPIYLKRYENVMKIPWDSSTSTVLGRLLIIHEFLVRGGQIIIYPKDGMYRYNTTLRYMDNIFKGNWNTMVYLLNKPPKCFEEFVARHFHDQAETILTTSKTYISWRVNTVDVPVPWQGVFDEMESTYYKLVNAFQENGSSLDNLSKLGIEFHGEPAWSIRARIILAVAACVVVSLIFYVILAVWKRVKERGLA